MLTESGIGEHYALGRFKELWFYLAVNFPGDAKGLKRLRKAQTMRDYREAATALFDGKGFAPGARFVG